MIADRVPGFSRRGVLLAVLFVAATAVYSIRLTSPFAHYHENVTACYANWGRNAVRLGTVAPVRVVDPLLRAEAVNPQQIYAHRPPIVTMIVSLSCRILGSSEAAVRLVGLLATLAMLAVFLAVASRLLGPIWGLAAAAIFAFVPDVAFYGVAIAHQTFGILGALLIVLAYLRWKESPTPKRLAAFAATTLLACWLDWPAFYAAGAVGLVEAIRFRKLGVALLGPGAALLSLALFVVYVVLLDPVGLVPFKDFLQIGADHSARIPLGPYFMAHAQAALRWFTIPLLGLAATGLLCLRPRADVSDAVILSTALLGADLVLFPELAIAHQFLNTPMVPFLVLAATRGLAWMAGRNPWKGVACALLVGFAAQSTLSLVRAHRGGNFPYYAETSRELGALLAQETRPEERSLVRLYVDPHITGFYSDRRLVLYQNQELWKLDEARIEKGVDEEKLIARLSEPGHGFSWFVTASPQEAAVHLPAVRASLDSVPDADRWFRNALKFESDREPSRLVASLRARYPEIRRHGFILFDLRHPR